MLGTQEDLVSLSSSFSKMLKRGFGKGPETCYTVLRGNRLFVYVRSFMTPAEEVLVKNNEIVLVARFRSAVIDSLSELLLEEASKGLSMNFDSLSNDWNYHTNSGIMVMELKDSLDYEDSTNNRLKENVLQLFQSVGSQMHKMPHDLKIVKFTHNICAIEVSSVMFPLAFLLYDNGNIDLLISHSLYIKNEYMKQKQLFEEAFNRSIEELFITWDFNHNKSYFIFGFERIYA
ncbi:Na-translocating system protein MpsC family protein [Bacillus suaedaesalsae]|uniref:DUF2294 family protein n=1 Tax=Bacillus suaedaesalsae TaxID=2810349 RepID=A0ABS2DDE3_9BACI|nr:Na-translocating system protein MpsC family protein [Bacillus suaedaesalsae]MBM6616478.1 DUF2294 family protein [Bacillus suaedaesalsae]